MEQFNSNSIKSLRIFSDEPAVKTGKGRILITPKQANNLRERILSHIDAIPDDMLRAALKAEIEHEFIVWYGEGRLNLEAKDFLINPNAEIAPVVAVDNIAS